MIKSNIKKTFSLTNNQVNLLLLSTMTSLFQGLTYFIIDRNRFSPKYFVLTVITCFIYYIFYYKTYVNADKTRSASSHSDK